MLDRLGQSRDHRARTMTINLQQLEHDASVFLLKGRPDHAIEAVISALRAEPQNLPVRSLLGWLYARLGHSAEAIECFRVVASAQASAGNLLAAVSSCHAILKLDPAHTGTQKLLAELFARQGAAPAPVRVSAPQTSAVAKPQKPWLLPAWLEEDDEEPPVVVGVEIPQLPELEGEELEVDPGTLPRVPLFSDLSRKAFVWLLPRLEVHRVAAGERITTEGDLGDSLFIVVAGVVRVEKRRAGGPPLIINRLGANTFFGEIALLGSGERSASVVAETDAELLELTREVLDELIEQHPPMDKVMRRFYRDRLLADLVKTSPLFRSLALEQVRDLSGRFKELKVERGTRLQVEGKRPSGLHIILDGRCEVSRTVDGRRAVVSEIGAGAAFGGTSFITGEAAATTVTARVRTTVVCVPNSTAPELLAQHPQMREILALVKDGGDKVMETALLSPAKAGKTSNLQGDLAQVPPTSLLVFFEMERMTGVLRLNDGRTRAALFLKAGRVLDVEAPQRVEEPMGRLSELLTWNTGRFEFSFEPVDREDRIQTGTTGLLLEAARVADEAAQGGKAGGEDDLSSLDD